MKDLTKSSIWPSDVGVAEIRVVLRRFSSVLLVLLVHPVAAHVLFQLAKQRDETLLQESVRCCKLGGCVAQLDDRADIEDCVRKTCDAEREAISKMPEYQKEKQLITASSNSGGGDDGGGGSGGGGDGGHRYHRRRPRPDAEDVQDEAPAAKKPKRKQKKKTILDGHEALCELGPPPAKGSGLADGEGGGGQLDKHEEQIYACERETERRSRYRAMQPDSWAP